MLCCGGLPLSLSKVLLADVSGIGWLVPFGWKGGTKGFGSSERSTCTKQGLASKHGASNRSRVQSAQGRPIPRPAVVGALRPRATAQPGVWVRLSSALSPYTLSFLVVDFGFTPTVTHKTKISPIPTCALQRAGCVGDQALPICQPPDGFLCSPHPEDTGQQCES